MAEMVSATFSIEQLWGGDVCGVKPLGLRLLEKNLDRHLYQEAAILN